MDRATDAESRIRAYFAACGSGTAVEVASHFTKDAVIYDTTVTSDLICSIDFGGAQTVTTGTFTIQWATEGILNLT